MRALWTRILIGLVIGLPWQCVTTGVAAQTTDEVTAIIEQTAAQYGANATQMLRLADCESNRRPWATGDRGTSHGLYQISALPTGLMWHFVSLGYSNPYDAHESASYVARVAVGEFANLGITLRRWSCYGR